MSTAPSPKKPVATAKPAAATTKAAATAVPKPAAAAAKRPLVSAAATIGATAPAVASKHQAVASDTTPDKATHAPTAEAAHEPDEESKEATDELKAAVHTATTSAPATSKDARSAGATATTAMIAGARASAGRRQALMRQMNKRFELIISKNPDAIIPPYMWIAAAKIHLKKLRASPLYFSNINTDVYNKDAPDTGGDIIYQQSESNLGGTTDTSMHLINARLKEGDAGFKAHFIQVQGPPMIISNVTDPLGTFRNKNQKLIKDTENKAFPDQHLMMWSHISRSYFIATGSHLKLIDSECEAFERWLLVAQSNFLLVLIDSDNLKKSLKPKPPAGKTVWVRSAEGYREVLKAFEKQFRLVKFDKFVKEQKALNSGNSANDEKSVRDVERVCGGDAARVSLHKDVFLAGGLASLDSDDEDEEDYDDDMENAGGNVPKKTKKVATAKKAAAGPVASLEYMAEKFTAATDVVLTQEQIDEYAEMEKSNQNILNIMCNKLYVALVDALPSGYDRSQDSYRNGLNLGMNTKPQRVPVRLFPHPDAPMAPEGLWPYRADTVEPSIVTGSTSSKAQVFDYGKKRVLADAKTAAKWAKDIAKKYEQSTVTQRVPVLDRLYKERNIVLHTFHAYMGFREDPCDLLEIHHREGDIEAHIFNLRATLNAPVEVTPGDKTIFSNMKLDSISSRTLFRAPAARIPEVVGRNFAQVGAVSFAGASKLLTKHSLGEETAGEVAHEAAAQKMAIVQDDDAAESEAAKSWSQDTRDMMHDLKMDNLEWVMQLPRLTGENAKSLVPALKAQCGLTESSRGVWELLPGEADRLYQGMVHAAQQQVTEGAAKTGDHLQANMQAARQLTANPQAVRKQLQAAARRLPAAAAASSVPTSAPTFGDDDDLANPGNNNNDDMVDAGAEYE